MQLVLDFGRVTSPEEFQARRAEKFLAFELWLEKQPEQLPLFQEQRKKNNVIATKTAPKNQNTRYTIGRSKTPSRFSV